MKHTRLIPVAAVLATFFAGRLAVADTLIKVDGNAADWASVASCEATDAGYGVPNTLTKMCLENNKTDSATNPPRYLYGLMEFNPASPPTSYVWFGLVVDTNKNGVTDDADRIYAVHYSSFATGAPTELDVYSAINHTSFGRYLTTSDCGGGSSGNGNGWSAYLNVTTGVQEMRIAYGCLGLTSTDDTRSIMMGASDNFQSPNAFFEAYPAYYTPSTGSVALPATPGNAVSFTAVAGTSQNTLTWTNSSQHDGVMILRSTGGPIDAGPVAHTSYGVDAGLGDARVVYVDNNGSSSGRWVDTGVTNNVNYYYQIFNHWQNFTYANGVVPTSAGIFSSPTSRDAGTPLWCYSEGVPNNLQPVTARNVGVYSAGNLGAVTANTTSATASLDGQEIWRPVVLTGAVQSRFPVVPLHGATSNTILTGDQNGRAYAINTTDGGVAWSSASVGAAIQAQPAVQLYDYANTLYQAAFPSTDLVFYGTSNALSTTGNKVVALNAQTGATAWTYNPGNMDIISGGMLVDYTNNRLWVASRGGLDGGQPSLRVLSSLDGGPAASYVIGNIDYGTNMDFGTKQAITITNTGKVYAYDISSMNPVWSYQVDAGSGLSKVPNSYAYPVDDNVLGAGFIVSMRAGAVQRYRVLTPSDAGTAVQQLWSVPVNNPTGVAIAYPNSIYVGSSDGYLFQIDATDGGYKSIKVSSTQVGMPSVDTTAGRVTVGGSDGRLCSYAVPF